MIPTPGQTKKHYGIGAFNFQSGETVALVRRCKRRNEIAELLEAMLKKHSDEARLSFEINFYAHQDDEVGAVVGGAAGKSFLLYLPTYNPWRNPIEMLWRCFRREVTHREMFERIKELIPAIY